MIINGKAAYELIGKFLDDLQNNAFSGINKEDAIEHIDNFLRIVDPLNLPNDDNHEVLTNDAFFDPEETYKDREHDISKFFRIKTGIFDFKTPLCTTFNEFNYLLKIDTRLFTHDIQEAKTYKKYRNKLNNDHEELWSENEDEALKQKATYERSWGNATQGIMIFYAWSKGCFGNFHGLDYELLVKLEEYWSNMNDHEYVSRKLNNHAGSNDEEVIREERKPNDDHGIINFDNDLVQDSAPYHTSEEEEKYNKDRCEMLGNPHQKLLVCKIRRFKMIKFSFGPVEKYIAIK
nr:hypothetical protein [Tanacetum cinerariifolium]